MNLTEEENFTGVSFLIDTGFPDTSSLIYNEFEQVGSISVEMLNSVSYSTLIYCMYVCTIYLTSG